MPWNRWSLQPPKNDSIFAMDYLDVLTHKLCRTNKELNHDSVDDIFKRVQLISNNVQFNMNRLRRACVAFF